ncbi:MULTISPECIES: glycosyltransferase [unclassified Pseudonocardia]|uniref:glycosyltransferase n=1 Tax=unclassified Pseudonocardia TaxID=2619320 RepID=UPI0025F27161|nr:MULTISPECIES: glycosyltransferase [unclassified Pseudonocardia]
MGLPTFDVAIPCYRYGAMLPTAVRSVLDQEGVEVRVRIIDDASGDGSADVARELAAADPRVEVVEHAENKGHIATFTEGVIDFPTGDYTLLMSADDALTPGALRRAADLFHERPDVVLVYGNAIDWDGSDPLPPARTGPARHVVHDGREWLRRRFAIGANCAASPAVITRTETQQKAGGYDAKCLHTSDFEMWMRLSLYGSVGFLADVDQAYCRGHGENMSVQYEERDGGVGDLRMRLLACTVLLEKAGDMLPDADKLDRTVRRRLAADALQRVSRSYDKGTAVEEANAQLVAFARETVGDLASLPEWHTLKLRERLGPKVAHAVSPLVVTAAGRRVRQIWRDRRLDRAGV